MKRHFKKQPSGSIFVLLSFPYLAVVLLRLLLYRIGLLRPAKVKGVKVVSVGNLTMGGTGKTPVTVMLAKMLSAAGKRVAVVSRGYSRSSKDPIQIVSDETEVLSSYPEAADEALLCAEELKGIPMICAPRRTDGIKAARDSFKTDYAILDDAFSHLAAHRDINLLLVDAVDPFGNGFIFPGGRLREPISSATRADAVLVTRANFVLNSEIEKIRDTIFNAAQRELPFFLCEIVPDSIIDRERNIRPCDYLSSKKTVLISAIASPMQFEETVRGLGADILAHHAFYDHHNFSEDEVARTKEDADDKTVLLATHKDYIRLPQRYKNDFCVLKISAKLKKGDEEKLKRLFG